MEETYVAALRVEIFDEAFAKAAQALKRRGGGWTIEELTTMTWEAYGDSADRRRILIEDAFEQAQIVLGADAEFTKPEMQALIRRILQSTFSVLMSARFNELSDPHPEDPERWVFPGKEAMRRFRDRKWY